MVNPKFIKVCRIRFPEIKLKTRDAHKLRGFFGEIFKEHSPLLHNHYNNGSFRYRYPLVQYKVIKEVPMLVGREEGANLLTELFLKIKELVLDGTLYQINRKNIEISNDPVGYSDSLHSYRFESLWMGLNQENFKVYNKMDDSIEKQRFLTKILVGNILGFFSNVGIKLHPKEKLMANIDLSEKTTRFKDKTMLAFEGRFIVNAYLPEYLGIGKSVSRGFGTIIKTREN